MRDRSNRTLWNFCTNYFYYIFYCFGSKHAHDVVVSSHEREMKKDKTVKKDIETYSHLIIIAHKRYRPPQKNIPQTRKHSHDLFLQQKLFVIEVK